MPGRLSASALSALATAGSPGDRVELFVQESQRAAVARLVARSGRAVTRTRVIPTGRTPQEYADLAGAARGRGPTVVVIACSGAEDAARAGSGDAAQVDPEVDPSDAAEVRISGFDSLWLDAVVDADPVPLTGLAQPRTEVEPSACWAALQVLAAFLGTSRWVSIIARAEVVAGRLGVVATIVPG